VALASTTQWLDNEEVVILIKKVKLCIWDRDFELPIEYDCYTGEKVTKEQIDAIEKFSKNEKVIKMAKEVVEKYCLKNVNADNENQKKDNIFSYIKPDYLFVKREPNPRVAIMCKYRYDQEHGLAVIVSSDEKITVGLQDIIL
jgi:hypothetical protein